MEDPYVDLIRVIVHPDLYTYQLHDEVELHLGLLSVLRLRLRHLLHRGLSLHILCKDILMLALFLIIPTLYLFPYILIKLPCLALYHLLPLLSQPLASEPQLHLLI